MLKYALSRYCVSEKLNKKQSQLLPHYFIVKFEKMTKKGQKMTIDRHLDRHLDRQKQVYFLIFKYF